MEHKSDSLSAKKRFGAAQFKHWGHYLAWLAISVIPTDFVFANAVDPRVSSFLSLYGTDNLSGWKKILLFAPPTDGEEKSFIANTSFFLAASGQQNAKAELAATLNALIIEANTPADSRSAWCRYPARVLWAKSHTPLLQWIKQQPQCADFETFKKATPFDDVYFVFSDYFLSVPSSLFGHTFLRLHVAGIQLELMSPQSEERDLVLNFEAATPIDVPPHKLIYNGTVGNYPGYFSIMPMANKVRDYSQLDGRHLWQYKINFSQAEKELLLALMWELKPAELRYYFFSKNCSYQALSILEAVRPTLDLRTHLSTWTYPSEAIRSVTDVSGLADAPVWRRHDKARERGDLSAPLGPHLGHYPYRAQLATGSDSSFKAFTELSFRGGLHSKDDVTAGYPAQFEMEVFKVNLRKYWDSPKLIALESIDFMRMRYFGVAGLFEPKAIWEFKLSYARPLHANRCAGCREFQFELAQGLSTKVREGFGLYLLPHLQIASSPSYDSGWVKSQIYVETGALLTPSERVSVNAQHLITFADLRHPKQSASLWATLRLGLNHAVFIKQQYSFYAKAWEWNAGFSYYF